VNGEVGRLFQHKHISRDRRRVSSGIAYQIATEADPQMTLWVGQATGQRYCVSWMCISRQTNPVVLPIAAWSALCGHNNAGGL